MILATVEAVITALQSGNITDTVLVSAGDLLSVETVNPTAEQTQQLKAALLDALECEQSASRAASLIWALGKSGDPQFKPIYVHWLRQFTESGPEYNQDIFQALIALDNLGEPVFEKDVKDRSSQSLLNAGKNLRQARAYLSRA